MESSKNLNVSASFKKYSYLFIKRLFDIICGLIGLIALIPITLILKIAFMISGDFAPIIFCQKRIGKDGKEFNFYKFRSMIPNADEELKKLLKNNKELKKEYLINKKLENDPRVTKIGKIIRATSIDELPQMINILQSKMSMIGNRPYLPREKKDMEKSFDIIVKTKPGLTGYWQVSGRSDVSFKERLKLEKYYSENASLKLDIIILLKTVTVVLFRKGAK